MGKIWRVAESHGSLLDTLLARRGLKTKSARANFLQPDYERDLPDPFLLTDMEKAVKRLLVALRQNERVMIFADYDADGVPAAALLAAFFRRIDFNNFGVYIPDRHQEAFGLSLMAVRRFATDGVKLIITVDCGSTDVAEVAEAKHLGLDVIITDHHLTPEILPPALATLNPKQPGDIYPNKMLCGTGVAFKLVQALIARGHFDLLIGWEKWLLDLVAIATIADMVPLVGENRALVHFGLKVLRKSLRPGLWHLCRATRLKLLLLTEDDVAFTLGPRLNAASRMAHGQEAYNLLNSVDEAEAGALAARLVTLNDARKQSVEKIMVSALEQAAELAHLPVLVLGAADWPLGVLGLAAAKLMENGAQAVFLWGQNGNGLVKGSCRSGGETNVVELMRAAGGQDFFSDFGGHHLAGGFSLSALRLPELGPRLLAAASLLPTNQLVSEVVADALLDLSDVTDETYSAVEQCAPFGVGNTKPLFFLSAAPLKSVKRFGNAGDHLEISFSPTAGSAAKAVGFFLGKKKGIDDVLAPGARADLLVHLERSTFKSQPELRLRLVDYRLPQAVV